MNVSIIVLTYNSSKHLTDCLDSIINNMSGKDELIVIDNNSTDLTRDILKNYKDKASIYFCNQNLGVTEGRNLGTKLAKNDIISFIDSDIVLDNNSLKNAKDSFVRYKADALIGTFSEYGEGCNWFVEMRRELFSDKRKPDFGHFITLKKFACFLGGLCLINKYLFDKYHGFDSKFQNYLSEDINFQLLLLRDNRTIVFEKGFSGNHYKSKMKFKGLVNKFRKNGLSVATLIKSSIRNHYKIPFNSGWPYLPIVAPLEILFGILSIFSIYFIIPTIFFAFYRCLIVFTRSKRNIFYNIKFICMRFYLDLIMFVYMLSGLLVNRKSYKPEAYEYYKL